MGFIPAPRWMLPRSADALMTTQYAEQGKLRALFGNRLAQQLAGKTVLDFGCGIGLEVIEALRDGAAQVVGLDIRQEVLDQAARRVSAAGFAGRATFTTSTTERVDIILSVDSFEHFGDPAAILAAMAQLLRPDGEIWVSFGPTWYHPLGGHLFSFFPWSHLIFTEGSLLRWRSQFRSDGARKFGEVAGGLNQMTIARFERLVAASPLQFAERNYRPIRIARRFHNRLTREFLTASVHCRLKLR